MADTYHAPPPSSGLSRDDPEGPARSVRQEEDNTGIADTSIQAIADRALWVFCHWNTKRKMAAREALAIINLLSSEYQKQVRRRRYFEREYQVQSRHLHNMRREYEQKLAQERSMRRKYESQLRQERSMRRAYEKQLQRQRSHDEQKEMSTAQSRRDTPYGPKVAKLLALAVCSESDGEAKAAFKKARTLHRPAV